MNDKFEYIIGNKLYVQKNHDEVYRIDLTNAVSRQILNNLNMGSKLNFDNFTKSIEVLGTDRSVYVTEAGSEECGCSMELRYIDSRTVSVKLHCAGIKFWVKYCYELGEMGPLPPYSILARPVLWYLPIPIQTLMVTLRVIIIFFIQEF